MLVIAIFLLFFEWAPAKGTRSPVNQTAQIFDALNSLVSDEQRHARAWPGNARSLSSYLRRLAPAFRRAGIEIVNPTCAKRRIIKLCKTKNFASPASSPMGLNNANDANDDNKASATRIRYANFKYAAGPPVQSRPRLRGERGSHRFRRTWSADRSDALTP